MPSPLILALDLDSAADARRLVATLGESVDFYKVGMELYAAAGMDFVRELAGQGKRVFLDLKLYDIGETVKRAVAQVAQVPGVTFLTVHGSRAVMRAAVDGRADAPLKLLAVTVLTSFDATDLSEMGYPCPVPDLVDHRVRNARRESLDGIVCSPRDLTRVRPLAGPDMLLVTPGVRSAGAALGDQKRVATPRQALADGADFLVIGRQVTRAQQPTVALQALISEIEERH